MPFIAIDELTNERIVVARLPSPREVVKGRYLKCQICGGRMYLRGGAEVRFHCYHHSVCTTRDKTNPESPEHIAGKFFIAEVFLPQLNDYAKFKPKYEEPIPEVLRVADIMLEFNMGWRIAHEIQLSGIGVNELNSRTNEYLRAGIDVLWWFGKSADTRTNRQWAMQHYGFSLNLYFNDNLEVNCGYWREEEKRDSSGRKFKAEEYKANSAVNAKEDSPVLSRVAYWWLEHSLFRYFQVWKKGNNDLYVRAFGATKRTIASFNGKTGAGKGRWFNKATNGDWVVDLPVFLDREEKYNKLKRLPEDVVDKIRSRARSNRAGGD